jgi:predicted AAA+ superfamily ATPase
MKELNKGLKTSIQNREIETKNKIKKAIESLKKKKLEITVSSIAKEGNISRPTVYKYQNYIEELFPIMISKNIQVKELEEKIKELKKIIKKQKDDINTLKTQNKHLIEQLIGMKEYFDKP